MVGGGGNSIKEKNDMAMSLLIILSIPFSITTRNDGRTEEFDQLSCSSV